MSCLQTIPTTSDTFFCTREPWMARWADQVAALKQEWSSTRGCHKLIDFCNKPCKVNVTLKAIKETMEICTSIKSKGMSSRRGFFLRLTVPSSSPLIGGQVKLDDNRYLDKRPTTWDNDPNWFMQLFSVMQRPRRYWRSTASVAENCSRSYNMLVLAPLNREGVSAEGNNYDVMSGVSLPPAMCVYRIIYEYFRAEFAYHRKRSQRHWRRSLIICTPRPDSL